MTEYNLLFSYYYEYLKLYYSLIDMYISFDAGMALKDK